MLTLSLTDSWLVKCWAKNQFYSLNLSLAVFALEDKQIVGTDKSSDGLVNKIMWIQDSKLR